MTADLLCADARAFILARELYVRPLVLVAAGLSAAAAMLLAAQESALIGGLVLLRPDLRPLEFFPGQAAAFAGAHGHSLSYALACTPLDLKHNQALAHPHKTLCCKFHLIVVPRIDVSGCALRKHRKALLLVPGTCIISRTVSQYDSPIFCMRASKYQVPNIA